MSLRHVRTKPSFVRYGTLPPHIGMRRLPRHSPILVSFRRHSQPSQRRGITISAILLPPTVFIGLLITLWTYKCMMMVLFQNKIIYMPSVPPFARKESIKDYKNACKPVEWRQEIIRSLDGTKIALAIGKNQTRMSQRALTVPKDGGLVIVYFQGNGSSLPPRLPGLSSVLKHLDLLEQPVPCTLVALSYRGYWTSSGRASQTGIEKDAAATLAWAQNLQAKDGFMTQLVLWGQSIGAGVATTAFANLSTEQKHIARSSTATGTESGVDAMILETPFTSVSNMLIAFYPQRWLPYRYLTPFLWNSWDSVKALRTIKQQQTHSLQLLLMIASKDEVVPPEEGEQLMKLCHELDFAVTYRAVPGALHTECLAKAQGREGIVDFLSQVYQDGKRTSCL